MLLSGESHAASVLVVSADSDDLAREDLRGAHNLGTQGTEHDLLFKRHLLGQRDDALVTLDGTGHREANT